MLFEIHTPSVQHSGSTDHKVHTFHVGSAFKIAHPCVKLINSTYLNSMVAKMWKSGSSFQGNVTIWWEILYFSIKKYIRNSGKCNYLPGKNTFFPDLLNRGVRIFNELAHYLYPSPMLVTNIFCVRKDDQHFKIKIVSFQNDTPY